MLSRSDFLADRQLPREAVEIPDLLECTARQLAGDRPVALDVTRGHAFGHAEGDEPQPRMVVRGVA